MSKKCPYCGRFMALSHELFDADEDFDAELAAEWGFDELEHDEWDYNWRHFWYVTDHWICDNCGVSISHIAGKRYYYNPDTGWYDGEKPLTPKEQVAAENKRQEQAGQLRLPI